MSNFNNIIKIYICYFFIQTLYPKTKFFVSLICIKVMPNSSGKIAMLDFLEIFSMVKNKNSKLELCINKINIVDILLW